MQILCTSYLFNYCSLQWMAFIANVTPLGARRGIGNEKENYSGFQWIQSGMFIRLWNICDHLFIYICVHMPYNPFSVPNRVHQLPHIDCCVITECSIMHYNKSCHFFFWHCTVFKYDKLRTQFVFNHALSILSVHYWGLHMCEQCFILRF